MVKKVHFHTILPNGSKVRTALARVLTAAIRLHPLSSIHRASHTVRCNRACSSRRTSLTALPRSVAAEVRLGIGAERRLEVPGECGIYLMDNSMRALAGPSRNFTPWSGPQVMKREALKDFQKYHVLSTSISIRADLYE